MIRHSARPCGYGDTWDPVSPWRSLQVGGQSTWDQGLDEWELHDVLYEQEAGWGKGRRGETPARGVCWAVRMFSSEQQQQTEGGLQLGFGGWSTHKWASLVAQTVKNLPEIQETQVWSLRWEYSLEKGMATHSSILSWEIPGTEEPGGLQSMGSQRIRHDWVTNNFTFTFSPIRAGQEPTVWSPLAHSRVSPQGFCPWLAFETMQFDSG